MKDKKKIIVILISIVVVISIIIVVNKKNTINFYLNGDSEVIVRYGSKFIDPGYVVTDGFGNDISEYVKVYGKVNPMILGTYRIVYEIDYHGRKTIERTVLVQNIPIEDLEIRLNGEEEVFLLKDNPYIEDGAYVYDLVDNYTLDSEYLSITSDLNSSVVGEYYVNYSLNYGGKSLSLNRKVIVFDIDYNLTPEELTNGNVNIYFEIGNISNYLNVKLPDNRIVYNRNIEYEVDSNGEYPFVISLTNNKSFTKIVTVDNIINNYVCKGEITGIGTSLLVTPTDDIKEYKWNINNEIISGGNSYVKNELVNNAIVELVFNNDKSYKVNCSIEDKLIYHFKYDENNTKPFMRNGTYSSSDKARLDAMLKQVVNEAGYGTRAGVVAAARFLVGGLDYKVPYEGGSYYRRVGLNIGQSGAWGSSGIGLDCYSFVSWARKQNGLGEDSLYSGDKYKTVDHINQIRVGDYLLTPCSGECKNPFKINHIALVIGVDSNYIYVAESKTVDVNALVVTKIDKKNPPTRYSLSLVKHEKYPSDGNITNMWM